MDADTTPILVPYPDSEELSLAVTVGACTLSLEPGASTGMVEGTYQDRSGKIPIAVDVNGGAVSIRQRHQFESIVGLFEQGAPRLDLRLGAERPVSLTIDGGANEVTLELGGIPLSNLEIRHGAGQVSTSFSAVNPVAMGRLRMSGGAGSFDIRGVANAGCSDFVAEGGAARFVIDFSGELQRDCTAKITTGAAGVTISVPGTTAARVRAQALLGSIETVGEFVTRDGRFWTGAALDGAGPTLDIGAEVAVGKLTLMAT